MKRRGESRRGTDSSSPAPRAGSFDPSPFSIMGEPAEEITPGLLPYDRAAPSPSRMRPPMISISSERSPSAVEGPISTRAAASARPRSPSIAAMRAWRAAFSAGSRTGATRIATFSGPIFRIMASRCSSPPRQLVRPVAPIHGSITKKLSRASAPAPCKSNVRSIRGAAARSKSGPQVSHFPAASRPCRRRNNGNSPFLPVHRRDRRIEDRRRRSDRGGRRDRLQRRRRGKRLFKVDDALRGMGGRLAGRRVQIGRRAVGGRLRGRGPGRPEDGERRRQEPSGGEPRRNAKHVWILPIAADRFRPPAGPLHRRFRAARTSTIRACSSPVSGRRRPRRTSRRRPS